MSLFQASVLNKYKSSLDNTAVTTAFERYQVYFQDKEIQENIRSSKEEQFQEGFLMELFVKVLGYTINPSPNFDLTTEFKNQKGAKKADGAIIRDGKAIGVIELKSTKTKNLEDVRQQAFDYKANQSACRYVVTSNFEKLRFYIDNAVEFEEFELFYLSRERFEILYLCLAQQSVFQGLPEKVRVASSVVEEEVTKRLYSDYSAFKNDLFDNIVELNIPPVISEEEAKNFKKVYFKNTQKLLDRFLFVFFAEDKGLLEPNTISREVNNWERLKEMDAYSPLYERYKKLFEHINSGFEGKDYQIFGYNGGLFQADGILDTLKIDDDLLKRHTMKLTAYDFESDVDVNILGHIFENSLSEIEAIHAELEGIRQDKATSKRKKDGIFYTPKFITKYIVEKTIGLVCAQRKSELKIIEDEYIFVSSRFKKTSKSLVVKNSFKKTIKDLNQKLDDYRGWLLQLAILDPACGSGAFLNQALEFLINEHRHVDELKARLYGDNSIVFPNIQNTVLERNIYGVDINEESVEIAKLSLWLRTAQKGRKLSILSNNIKCGDSLIDDFKVAGDGAFQWEKEFPEVFEKGGFDCIIGNPPYGILIEKGLLDYYTEHFPLTSYKTNLYILFVERMFQLFRSGTVHFIIPKSLLFNSFYDAIRRYLIENSEINEIATITEKVFEDAEVGSSLLLQFTLRDTPNTSNQVKLVAAETIADFILMQNVIENVQPQSSFLEVPNCEISIVSSDANTIMQKLMKHRPMRDFYKLKNGLNPGNIKPVLISSSKETELHRPIIWGKEISKYSVQWGGDYVNYDETIGERISLDDLKSKDGMNKQTKVDFALRSKDLFDTRKIVVRKTGDSLIASLDEDNYYFDTLVHGIYETDAAFPLEYALAILNSSPATIFYRLLHDIKGKVFAKISLDNLGSFPIPEATTEERDHLVALANSISKKRQMLTTESGKFLSLLRSEFALDKFSKKLLCWHELEWKETEKELEKKKVSLSLAQKSEWLQFHKTQSAVVGELATEIRLLTSQVDNAVYDLFKITAEEKAMLKG